MKKQWLSVLSLLAGLTFCCGAAETVLNDDFSTNAVSDGAPAGWAVYKTGPVHGKIGVREKGSAKVLYLNDTDDKSEIGITRRLSAVPGKYYRLSAEVLPGAKMGRQLPGLQLRFLKRPANTIKQVPLAAGKTASVTLQADADMLQIYLYTMRAGGQSELSVGRIKLEVSDKPF